MSTRSVFRPWLLPSLLFGVGLGVLLSVGIIKAVSLLRPAAVADRARVVSKRREWGKKRRPRRNRGRLENRTVEGGSEGDWLEDSTPVTGDLGELRDVLETARAISWR